jgi:hypothetical protein
MNGSSTATSAARKQLRADSATEVGPWPEFRPGLGEAEQYENAIEAHFNPCDYGEAQLWESDAEVVLDALRRGFAHGNLAEAFGGEKTEGYWNLVYAMARLQALLGYVVALEGPVFGTNPKPLGGYFEGGDAQAI